MKRSLRIFSLLIMALLAIVLASCSSSAENEYLPEYCRTYSGFMSTASRDLYDLVGGVNERNYLSVISEIELEFEVDDPSKEINLNGIQCFQNLTSLTLIGQSFKDISQISALKNIQKISLIDTNVVSISSFSNLSKVNALTISNTKTLQSVDGVEEMTKLTYLDISDNGIVNIDGLNNLVNLETLILRNNEITFFPSINNLNKLKDLDVSNNNIIQLGDDLSGLSNLVTFNASKNQICDLSTLDDLVALETLDLSFNDLGCTGDSPDFSSLENAPELTTLLLNDNDLTSIEDLRGKNLPLISLHIENNLLTDITPIGAYTTIEELKLNNNLIDNIDDLSGMVNLSEIDLSHNLLIDFEDLLSIPDLQFIDLSENQITYIPVIESVWPNLSTLDLHSNNIVDNTYGVEGHSNLTTLILNDNGLVELGGITDLPNLENLILFVEADDTVDPPILAETNPNQINLISNSFNNVPSLDIIDDTYTLDLGFELSNNAQILGSFNDIDNLGIVDLSNMDIDVIDINSFNLLPDLEAIYVQDNNISDISFILGSPSLRQINISGNPVSNLTIIEGTTQNDLDNLEQVVAKDITTANALTNAFIDLPDLNFIDLTGTNIVNISGSINDLAQLSTLLIDSPVITSIDHSFNNIFAAYRSSNVISFDGGEIGSITNSFNVGNYEQIAILDQTTLLAVPIISNSFNDISVNFEDSIVISGNYFETVTGSFNNVSCKNLFLSNNDITSITDSFGGTTVNEELNLQNNYIATLDLSSIITVASLDMSYNSLSSVEFIDGITGLESLDISSQLSSDGTTLTLTTIDGINNLPLLQEVVMDDLGFTSIVDSFQNVGLTTFAHSFTTNKNIFIESISPESFTSSLLTNLDLSGHQLDNIDFLEHINYLEDLTISVDMLDLAVFTTFDSASTLNSLTLESVQSIDDFSVFETYDQLQFFALDSSATTIINNFDGLDNLNNANFDNADSITEINNSFNNFLDWNLSSTYLNNYSSLTDIKNSFDVYGNGVSSFSVELPGEIYVLNSFNNLQSLVVLNDIELEPNFDNLSFDLMTSITLSNPQYDTYSLFLEYSSLDTINIDTLSKNITNLSNTNVSNFTVSTVENTVDTVNVDIASDAQIDMSGSVSGLFTITNDSEFYSILMLNANVVINNENTSISFDGDIADLTINSSNLVETNFGLFNAEDVIINSNTFTSFNTERTGGYDADTLTLNTLVTILDITVFATQIHIYDNLVNTLDVQASSAALYVNTLVPNLVLNANAAQVHLNYNSLETLTLSGSVVSLNVESQNVDTITLGTSTISSATVITEVSNLQITGSNINALTVTDDSMTQGTLLTSGASVDLSTSIASGMLLDINANSLVLNGNNVPNLTFSATSDISILDLSNGASIGTILYSTATIDSTSLTTNEATLSFAGTQPMSLDITAPYANDITIDNANSDAIISSSAVAMAFDLNLNDIELENNAGTNVTIDGLSTIHLFDASSANLISNFNSSGATINSVLIDTNSTTLSYSGENTTSTLINGDNFISITADSGTNQLEVISSKTGSMTVDLISGITILRLDVTTLSIASSSVINNVTLHNNNVATLLMGTASVEGLTINGGGNSLDITGASLSNLQVIGGFTSFNGDLPLTTNLVLETSAVIPIDVTTTTSDITLTAASDVTLHGSYLDTTSLSLGTSNITFDVTTAAVDYLVAGTAGDLLFEMPTMATLELNSGANFDSIELADTNVTSLDFTNSSVDNLVVTSTKTSMSITDPDLISATLYMPNLNALIVNSPNADVVIENNTTAFDIDGEMATFSLTNNTLTSINFDTLSVGTAEITGLTLANVDTTPSLGSVGELIITSPLNNFALTTDVDTVTFTSNAGNTLFVDTTQASINITSNVNRVDVTGATTTFNISSPNLSSISGTADVVNLTQDLDSGLFTVDLDANSIFINSSTIQTLFFIGIRTIDNVDVTSDLLTTLATNDVVINTLTFDSTSNVSLSTKADVVTETLRLGKTLNLTVSTDNQVYNVGSSTLVVGSTNSSNTTINYPGTEILNVEINNLGNVALNASAITELVLDVTMSDLTTNTNNVDTVTITGLVDNVTLSGPIEALTTTLFAVSNTFTMNDSILTDLSFASVTLLGSVGTIQMNTLDIANIESIITTLQGTGITLSSLITETDIDNYYYDIEYTSLRAQEDLDLVHYDSIKDPLVAAGLAEVRLNSYFDYIIDDSVITTSISTQTMLTAQDYFDGYRLSLDPIRTEEEMVTDEGQAFVDEIKASIQATLDSPELDIDEVAIAADVEALIVSEAHSNATLSTSNIGFLIG